MIVKGGECSAPPVLGRTIGRAEWSLNGREETDAGVFVRGEC